MDRALGLRFRYPRGRGSRHGVAEPCSCVGWIRETLMGHCTGRRTRASWHRACVRGERGLRIRDRSLGIVALETHLHGGLMLSILGLVLLGLASAYATAAWIAMARWTKSRPSTAALLPISILKPLHGDDPGLEPCLHSFCNQDYPDYEIIFGIQDPEDPALAVVEKLCASHPERTFRIVVSREGIGANPKVNNLHNLYPLARHPWIVISDSDILVPQDYLRRLVPPLGDDRTGLVTCLYGGRAGNTFWARLGKLFIDDGFAPSVWVAWLFGSRAYAFGATLALRRETLERIGGFRALADRLADDYRMGELIRRLGLEVVLAPLAVQTLVTEGSASALWRHELRWLRTIRFVNPLGFAFFWMTLGSPLILTGTLALGWGAGWAAIPAAAVAVALRVVLHYQSARSLNVEAAPVWLVPIRDFLTLVEWAGAFFSRQVYWKGLELRVGRGDGVDRVRAPDS